MPKSGEDDDHIHPVVAADSMAITVSGIFGTKPATRSPDSIPNFLVQTPIFQRN
ncbi:MAG: hypothetical protein CM1200mP1_15390 [Candidatus Neomarinimicrobiota bacterium]|nr:MAG: hypothetical protein CM1200mP1_15390 [Candidatus Neomarinimicrobiota bacterium]